MAFPFLLSAQQAKGDRDFSAVDSAARCIQYEHDIYKLTKSLTQPYSEELLKVRSIFIWITHNIHYDYKFYNKGKEVKVPECKPGENCQEVMDEWEKAYINKVLKKKKGVCQGYAMLFKKMCDIAGIKSEIIAGYTKTRAYQVGMAGPADHGWNAVFIDSTWHFLDATWAAGVCEEDEDTGKLLSFKKAYNNYYWFTPFHDLARDHYPQDGKWVFEANYTKEKFANNPWIESYILPNIQLQAPASGVITAKKGDTIHFKFDYNKPIKYLQINSNVFRNPSIYTVEKIKKKKVVIFNDYAVKKQRYISFTKEGTSYTFDYVVTDESLYYLEILFDHYRTMRFKVIVPS